MKALVERFNALSLRERLLVGAAGIAVLIAAFFVGVWEPLVNGRAQLSVAIDEKREAVTWMREAAAQVEQLARSKPTVQRVADGRSLLAIVDQTARRSNLGGALKRVEPDGRSGVRVWFEDAVFDDLLLWLGNIQRSNGVSVSRVTIDRQDNSGIVKATLVLESGGAS